MGGFSSSKGDVSPIEDKAQPAVTIVRKDISAKHDVSPQGSPVPASAHPASPPPARNTPNGRHVEVAGSVPPLRHEVGNDGQIVNTVTTRGMELDANQQPANLHSSQGGQGYQESRQGPWAYNYPGQGEQVAHEVDGGQHAWRQELPAQGRPQQGSPQGQQGYRGQQYGGAYEMGPSR